MSEDFSTLFPPWLSVFWCRLLISTYQRSSPEWSWSSDSYKPDLHHCISGGLKKTCALLPQTSCSLALVKRREKVCNWSITEQQWWNVVFNSPWVCQYGEFKGWWRCIRGRRHRPINWRLSTVSNHEKPLCQTTYKGVVAAADGLTDARGAAEANDGEGATVD